MYYYIRSNTIAPVSSFSARLFAIRKHCTRPEVDDPQLYCVEDQAVASFGLYENWFPTVSKEKPEGDADGADCCQQDDLACRVKEVLLFRARAISPRPEGNRGGLHS